MEQLERRSLAKEGGSNAARTQQLRDELSCLFDDAQARAFQSMDEVLPLFLTRLDRSQLTGLRSTLAFFTMEDLVLGRALGSSSATDAEEEEEEAGCRIS